ncbi:oligopeptide transporter [Nemania sp. FL0031]|nr:oligopeptide transporter [Nemania sp. FL0031]
MTDSSDSDVGIPDYGSLHRDDDNHSPATIPPDSPDVSFSLRALTLGLALGVLVNAANTYYGLQAGISSQMPMITGLLGYMIVQSLRGFAVKPLSFGENVLVISAATATGCMPVTAGFTGVIPALEFVLAPEDGGRLHLNTARLLLWSFGSAFFGIAFAAWLRKPLIEKRESPWPGAHATARMLRTLHEEKGEPHQEETRLVALSGPPTNFKTILRYGVGSFGVLQAILTFFFPILRTIPIFGIPAARDWSWSFNFSPGFIGGGIITGPVIPLHMLAGAIVGWAILSPLAIHKGWAHGPVEDWETGSRAWIIWVSLSCLMADAAVFLVWFIIEPMKRALAQIISSNTPIHCVSGNNAHEPLLDQGDQNALPPQKNWLASSTTVICATIAVASCFCIISVQVIFHSVIPWYFVLLAVILALPMAVVGIRALAECDFNPESPLLSQLVFAALLSKSNPHAFLSNLVSAGLASACASQAGDIAYDFKIGSLVGGSPRAQIYGHVAGSVFGSFVATAMYRLYTSRGVVPGPVFQIPASHLTVNTTKLLLGTGLPNGVAPFVATFGTFFVVVAALKLKWPGKRWHTWIPSGTAFAIGMANTPSFSLPRVVGGIISWLYLRHVGSNRDGTLGIGTGLALGETLGSVTILALSASFGFV